MRGSTDAADPGARLLDPEVTALVVDLRFEPPGGLLGIPCKRETGKIVAFVQDVLGLPEERADFCGIEVVRLGFLEDRFARGEDRLGFFDYNSYFIVDPILRPCYDSSSFLMRGVF